MMNVNKMWRQKCRRLEAKCKSLQEAEDNTGNDKLLQIERTRGGKRLTLEGTVSLAIRRNFGNCATADVGAMLLEDISRFTVARAVVKAGTALLASSRFFFHNLYQDVASRSPGEFKLTIHSYIQDATNSGILKGSKLAALILRSAYLRDYVANAADGCEDETYDFDDAQNFDFTSWFETIVRVADILPVHGSDSAVTAAQTLKHLEGLGCMTWKDILNQDFLKQMLGWATM